jgi:hypothetical protein
MNPNLTSLFFMLAAIAAFSIMAIPLRKNPGKIFAGILAGLLVGLINILVEFFGARNQIYFVHGLWMFAHSSMALTAAWILFAACFALGTESIKKLTMPQAALMVYISVGIIIGTFSDFAGQSWLGHFQMGPNGNWLFIIPIWLILVPATVAIYGTVDKIFARRPKGIS